MRDKERNYWFMDYRNDLITILVINFVLGVLHFFTSELTGVYGLIIALLAPLISNIIIALIFFGISWIFERGFTLKRYLKILASWSFIVLFIKLVSLFF